MNISVRDLKLSINNIKILKGISFTIPDSGFTSVIGPNGSGKSSILRIISKDIDAYSGFVTDIAHGDMTYLPQDIAPPSFLSVTEIVCLGFYERGLTNCEKKIAVEKLLDSCGIAHIKHHTFTDISAGEMQRAWLAFALAQAKNLILMDESLADIDRPARTNFFKVLRSIVDGGKTLVLVTHDVDLAVEFSDNLLFLKDGRKLFDGNPSDFHSSLSSDQL